MIPAVEAAKARLEDAQRLLAAITAKAYPVGAVVKANLGGNVVKLRVDQTGRCWWSSPGEIVGTNVKTGKTRTFFDYQVVEIVSKPEPSHEN